MKNYLCIRNICEKKMIYWHFIDGMKFIPHAYIEGIKFISNSYIWFVGFCRSFFYVVHIRLLLFTFPRPLGAKRYFFYTTYLLPVFFFSLGMTRYEFFSWYCSSLRIQTIYEKIEIKLKSLGLQVNPFIIITRVFFLFSYWKTL